MNRITMSRSAIVLAAMAIAGWMRIVPTMAARAADDDRVVERVIIIEKHVPAAKPLIQIALLLDTSNSMDGLIDQAKAHLWRVINEFATAKRDGVRPDLRVALYEYGNDSLPSGEGYVRLVVPLTDDLDKVSQELFALTTNGGSEYCGQVIRDATGALEWSKSNKDYKAIFIAGNEPFTQGDVGWSDACRGAIARGIIVNTIFCGDHEEGVNTKWKDGALLADGSYLSINQDQALVHVDAPQDKELAELNAKLNDTYIAYGAQGEAGAANQADQDANAASVAPSVVAERAVSKSSGYYRNDTWDLCDACKEGKVKIEDVKEEDLPDQMKKMTLDERRAYVQQKTEERAAIQKQIQTLAEARTQYVAAELAKRGDADKDTLGAAMIDAVREQAGKAGFVFDQSE